MNITDIKDAFDHIAELSELLCNSLNVECGPYWTSDHGANTDESFNLIRSSLANFWYQDGQEGRETKTYIGFMGVNQEQLDLIHKINSAKDHFKAISTSFSQSHKSDWLEIKGKLGAETHKLHQLMGLSGLGRLHLKQTWRTIPVFDTEPHRIGFNWYSNGKSITKVSVADCYKLLEGMDQDALHIKAQLTTLSGFNENYSLARVQTQTPVMRVNIFYRQGEETIKKARNASLPIFYLNESGTMPSHNEPSAEPPETRIRAVRKDSKIEVEPILPSIRVHKYID